MGNNSQSIKQWNALILASLNKNGPEYVLASAEDLVGCYIGLYAKRAVSHRLTDIATSKLKLGFSGKMGNKGATLLRFFIEDTSFCFINCHLESGKENKWRRIEQINEIYANAFIKERGT